MLSSVPGQERADPPTDSVCPDIFSLRRDKELSQRLDFIGSVLAHSAEVERLTAFLDIRCCSLPTKSNCDYFFKIKL